MRRHQKPERNYLSVLAESALPPIARLSGLFSQSQLDRSVLRGSIYQIAEIAEGHREQIGSPHDYSIELSVVLLDLESRLRDSGHSSVADGIRRSLERLRESLLNSESLSDSRLRCAQTKWSPEWVPHFTSSAEGALIREIETFITEWSGLVKQAATQAEGAEVTMIQGYPYPVSRAQVLQHCFGTALQEVVDFKNLLSKRCA